MAQRRAPRREGRHGWIAALFVTALASGAAGLELSVHELPITTDDQVAPAVGTLTLVGLFDDLPPGSQVVAGGYTPGQPVILVRASLTEGEIFSIGGVVSGDEPQIGGGTFCCVGGTGYTPNSDRIPGPDEFFPFVWEWFFDATAVPPGPLVPGEEVEIWASFTQLVPGNSIEFFAYGPSPAPCPPEGCPSLGTAVVVGAKSVPALGSSGRIGLVVVLLGLSIGLFPARRRWHAAFCPSEAPRRARGRGARR